MKIIGNGVDIIENKRIKKSIKKSGFVNRIFTQNEINQSKRIKNKVNFFAKRFAAKEAFVKSIGTGFRNNINFKDIEIKNNNKGKPLLNLSKNIKFFLKKKFKLKKYNIYLSLSDEKKYSIAYIIIDKIK
tara:strand:+ start:1094 stop:1483 length:390 start_codon:yes stop_codon:yes gene_type:complete